jgi:hypothetical protein
MAPDAAVARVRDAINRRPKRVLGVLKVDREYVGVVGGTEFEIWERRDHAIHAVGRVRGQRGGTRIETAFRLSRRTRALLVLLLAAYAIAVLGILQLPEERPAPLPPVVIAVAGALILTGGFLISARRQRSSLRRFVSELFADVLANTPPA